MADTGENRQIVGRVNAKEAETVRKSQKVIQKERSTAKATNAAFIVVDKRAQGRSKKTKKRRSAPATPMM